MQHETGVVVSVDGDSAEVELERTSACKGCKGCSMTSKGTMLASAHNDIGARLGDRVLLVLDESRLLKAAAVVYLVPLVALLGGFLLGYGLAPALSWPPTLLGLIFAGAFLVAAFFVIYRYDNHARENRSFNFKIESLGKEEPGAP